MDASVVRKRDWEVLGDALHFTPARRMNATEATRSMAATRADFGVVNMFSHLQSLIWEEETGKRDGEIYLR